MRGLYAGLAGLAGLSEARGEVASSQSAGVRGWVEDHSPSSRAAGGAGVLARLVKDLAAGSRRGEDLAGVRRAVFEGRLAPGVAVTVLDQFTKLAPRLAEGVGPTVLEHLVDVGCSFGTRAVRELRTRLIAEFGSPGEFDRIEESNRRYIDLSVFSALGDGIWRADLTVNTEGKAVIEAAIGPLSRPAPLRDERDVVLEPDERTSGQRRGQALVEVCRRWTGGAGESPGGMKAAIYVTMHLEDLRGRCGAGRTVGALGSGDLLPPEQVRRLACDAGVIPVVLGSGSEPVDVGKTQRLFPAGLVKQLWIRDEGCTFPGCDTPAHWCDAHHLQHWVDDGPTALSNGALLCGRHHTVVHQQRLHGEVTAEGVVWDQAVDSYDRWLANHHRGRLRRPA